MVDFDLEEEEPFLALVPATGVVSPGVEVESSGSSEASAALLGSAALSEAVRARTVYHQVS